MTGPLATLGTNKLGMISAQNVPVPNGQEHVLYEGDGPGCVKTLWMAIGGGNNPALDGRLRIYYDGNATPAFDMDLGTLLVMHWGADGNAHTVDHVHAEINKNNFELSFLLSFPMPFGSHIKVTYYYPPGYTQQAGIYYMLTGALTETDEANGWRLRSTGKRWADQAVSRNKGDENVIANLTGPGSLVYIAYVGGVNAQNFSWMERDFSFSIDGEVVPSIRTTGTEDTFDSGWYYQGWKNFNVGLHSYIGTDGGAGGYAVGMCTDLWGKWGGVPYETSAIVKILTEPAVATGDSFCYCVLYYGA